MKKNFLGLTIGVLMFATTIAVTRGTIVPTNEYMVAEYSGVFVGDLPIVMPGDFAGLSFWMAQTNKNEYLNQSAGFWGWRPFSTTDRVTTTTEGFLRWRPVPETKRVVTGTDG